MTPFDTPVIIAHRGYSANAPENTLAAFHAAEKAGALWVECDIRRTLDGMLVVHHDASLGRTTSGTGYIRNATWDYIGTLDAGGWFSSDFQSERVPTIDQLFENVPHSVAINLEIKPPASRHSVRIEFIASILDSISRWNRQDSVLVSSFSLDVLRLLRAADSSIEIGYLTHGNVRIKPTLNVMKELNAAWFIHNIRTLRSSVVPSFHAQGHKVAAFTVNTPKQAEYAVKCGLDYIITNHVTEMKGYFEEIRQRFISDSTISATR